MVKTSGGFRAALLAGWMSLCVIGLWYARWKGIPNWAALPALAAFLVEYPFYLLPAFRSVREELAGAKLPWILLASAVLPYLVCCVDAIHFQWISFIKLAALALTLSLWYKVLPAHPLSDAGFLCVVAGAKLGRYMAPIYPTPMKGVELGILGDLALIHIAALSLMLERRVRETGYGFWPARRDWIIGVKNFVYFAPVGFALALLLHAAQLTRPTAPLRLIPLFFGFLVVLGLSEEFLFRGVLQQWIEDWTWSRPAALVLTSMLFGLVHLWFRTFPNWRWAIIAAVLGWFCGRARNQAGSIRASMVTHTLVVTAWRAFFS